MFSEIEMQSNHAFVSKFTLEVSCFIPCLPDMEIYWNRSRQRNICDPSAGVTATWFLSRSNKRKVIQFPRSMSIDQIWKVFSFPGKSVAWIALSNLDLICLNSPLSLNMLLMNDSAKYSYSLPWIPQILNCQTVGNNEHESYRINIDLKIPFLSISRARFHQTHTCIYFWLRL